MCGVYRVVDNTLKDMIVVEIADPSGFPVDKSSIEQGPNIRRVEKSEKMTAIYYGDVSTLYSQNSGKKINIELLLTVLKLSCK